MERKNQFNNSQFHPDFGVLAPPVLISIYCDLFVWQSDYFAENNNTVISLRYPGFCKAATKNFSSKKSQLENFKRANSSCVLLLRHREKLSLDRIPSQRNRKRFRRFLIIWNKIGKLFFNSNSLWTCKIFSLYFFEHVATFPNISVRSINSNLVKSPVRQKSSSSREPSSVCWFPTSHIGTTRNNKAKEKTSVIREIQKEGESLVYLYCESITDRFINTQTLKS